MTSCDTVVKPEYGGQINLPNGRHGAGWVSGNGVGDAGVPKVVPPRLVQVIMVLNDRHNADATLGVHPDVRGWVSYEKMATQISEMNPKTLTPTAKTLVVYVALLKRLLRAAMPGKSTVNLLETKRNVGVRLRLPLLVLDRSRPAEDPEVETCPQRSRGGQVR